MSNDDHISFLTKAHLYISKSETTLRSFGIKRIENKWARTVENYNRERTKWK